jgi:zinc-ribbon domain
MCLSEQTKTANLFKEIKEAQKQKKISAAIIGIGCVIIFAGIALNTQITGLFFFLIVYGIYVFVNYSGKSNKLMKELEKTVVSNPACTNCGKELSNKNYEFCPFCGKSLNVI